MGKGCLSVNLSSTLTPYARLLTSLISDAANPRTHGHLAMESSNVA